MPKLIVHIGLPKTATTTLQAHLFPATLETTYLGVNQPRRRQPQLAAFQRFTTAIRTGELDAVRTELDALTQTATTHVLSDEMLTVSQPDLDWRTKLARLSTLVHDLDYAVLVTVREPVAAMYSYYVERYSIFSASGAGFMATARHHEAMEIYHYGELVHALDDAFSRDRVTIMTFEDIIAGNLSELYEILGQQPPTASSTPLKKTNDKRRTASHVHVTEERTLAGTVKQAVNSMGAGRVLDRVGILDSRPMRQARASIRPLLRKLPRVSRTHSVPLPTDEERQQLHDSLKRDNQTLVDYCGVDYR